MNMVVFFFVTLFLLSLLLVVLVLKSSFEKYSPDILYKTEFGTDVTKDFTRFNPCLQGYVHKGPSTNFHLMPSGVKVSFPSDETGTSDTLYARIGGQAFSWCDYPIRDCCSSEKPCCPPVGNTRKGRFEYWVYFPPTDCSKKNDIHPNDEECVFPFYKGGKLPGVCSGKCPTGNSKTNPDYENGWTLRLMFRQNGRLALLYSVPQKGISLDPVPTELKHCFTEKPFSISTDQYWFCTSDQEYATAGHRLAQYTFSQNSEDNVDPEKKKTCADARTWTLGDGTQIPNPIRPILIAGSWNFLRVQFDVDKKRVQVLHTVATDSSPDTIPQYSPSAPTIVLDTQENGIPFVSSSPVSEVYWQPFFGGADSSWYPGCYDSQGKQTFSNCQPEFIFGDFLLYYDWVLPS